jgi:gluconate 2-dehydrogenase subunit 3-like protein
MELDRRELFRIIVASLPAAHAFSQEYQGVHAADAMVDISSYQPRALSPAQYRVLDSLSEILLPAGEDGLGAHDAGVAYYIDTVLHYGDQSQRDAWCRGLDAAANGGDLESNIARWAKSEMTPQTEDEKFFVIFKDAVIRAFYQSAVGRKCVGYKGDTALSSFAGCTHKEHQVS